jgi:hypothetical protein
VERRAAKHSLRRKAIREHIQNGRKSSIWRLAQPCAMCFCAGAPRGNLMKNTLEHNISDSPFRYWLYLKHIKQRSGECGRDGRSARLRSILSLSTQRNLRFAPVLWSCGALRMDTLQGDGMFLHDFQMISHINQLSSDNLLG